MCIKDKNNYIRNGVRRCWITNSADEVYKYIKTNITALKGKQPRTFDFAKMYTELPQDKILLNQNFISPAVMILKKDGLIDENVILINQILLPDLNVDDYLKRLYYKKNKALN